VVIFAIKTTQNNGNQLFDVFKMTIPPSKIIVVIYSAIKKDFRLDAYSAQNNHGKGKAQS
jgi:hypothetical protein